MVKKLIIVMSVFLLLYFFLQQKNTDSQLSSDSVLPVDSRVSPGLDAVNDVPEIINNSSSPAISRPVSITDPKLEPEIQQALEKRINTSSKGLKEEATNKGVNIDLQGRFHNVPVATVGEDGKIEINGYNSLPIQGKKND